MTAAHLMARLKNHNEGDCQGYPTCPFCRQEHLGIKPNIVFTIATYPRSPDMEGVKGWAVISIGHRPWVAFHYIVRSAGMPMRLRTWK